MSITVLPSPDGLDQLTAIGAVMKYLKAAFPSPPIAPATEAVYFEMLADIEPASLLAAARLIVAESTFFPRVNELRAAAKKLTVIADDAPSVEAAWRIAQAHAGDYLRSLVLDYADGKPYELKPVHARVARAVKVIGAQRIFDNENESTLFAQFRNAYENLTRQDTQPALPPAVAAEVKRIADLKRIPTDQIEAPKAAEKPKAHPELYKPEEIATTEELVEQSERAHRATREWLDEIALRSKPLNSETVDDPLYQHLLRNAAPNAERQAYRSRRLRNG